ncbi:expressed unknown protein [Seminavis robusta]|uniref:Uncharacterized protein n=1 Tax=Seminavis robusta TaxID=568900 RepID=A0A9N8DZI9_9STRA|nr:expressed unknown protein [Seminavis robusta]|eukprot:Sro365_g127410.1 n/a (243) ;mRNA; r:44330-45058
MTKELESSSSSLLPRLTFLSANVLWLATTIGGLLTVLHHQQTNDISNLRWDIVISLLFFNNLNLLIAMIEISLGIHISLIKSDYKKLKARNQEALAAVELMNMEIPWNRLFDGKLWSRMWSTYALYDPSYQNDESYGFFIDVGNGWSTIPPCLLMNAAIVLPQHFSPLFVGCVCLASYWQMMYGTIVYFLSYIWNERYKGKPLVISLGIVGIANGIWMVFPSIGIYACVSILDKKDFSVFGY